MSLIQRITDLLQGNNDIVGVGNNLQEALDDYAEKVRSLGPNQEITDIDVGETDEQGNNIPWFTLNLGRE